MRNVQSKAIVSDNDVLNKRFQVFISVFALVFLFSSSAFAGGGAICVTLPIIGTICIGGGGACAIGGGTLGSIICNLLAGTALIPYLLAALSYLFGLYLVTMAILKVRDHVEEPRQTPISESVKRFVAGGAFLALPMVTSVLKNTLTAGSGALWFNSGFNGALSGSGLDVMIFALVYDLFGPMMKLISGFGYLAGIVLTMIGISRLLKSAQEGPKGPGGIGTIFTFITAGVLFSIDSIMRAATGSLFGLTTVSTFGLLSTTTGDVAVDGHIMGVISSVIGFMIIIGLIAFVRGIFILREVAEGSGQASVMAAMSHIIGGALAVNIGSVINAVQNTFGLSFIGFS